MAKDLPAITPLRAMRDQAAKFANEARGRKVARELSDDPAEAEAQAEEYLEGEYPHPPLRDLRRPKVRSPWITEETGDNYEGGWDIFPDMSVAQAASPEGGQTVEEARAQYEREVGNRPTAQYPDAEELPGYSGKLRKLMSGLSPEDQALLVEGFRGKDYNMRLPSGPLRSLLRPEIRRVVEQERKLYADLAAEHERMRPQAKRKAEFEEEFPEETGGE